MNANYIVIPLQKWSSVRVASRLELVPRSARRARITYLDITTTRLVGHTLIQRIQKSNLMKNQLTISRVLGTSLQKKIARMQN